MPATVSPSRLAQDFIGDAAFVCQGHMSNPIREMVLNTSIAPFKIFGVIMMMYHVKLVVI